MSKICAHQESGQLNCMSMGMVLADRSLSERESLQQRGRVSRRLAVLVAIITEEQCQDVELIVQQAVDGQRPNRSDPR